MSTVALWLSVGGVLLVASLRRPPPRRQLRPTSPRNARAAGLGALARATWQRAIGTDARRRDAQLSLALEQIASAVRSGSSLSTALTAVAAASPDPIGRELRAISAEVEAGAPLAGALRRWGESAATSDHTRLAATAMSVAATAGGEVARSVDRVAATLRERREVQAEARALATQARASALVLAVAPLAFTALVAGVEPGVLTFLVASPVGLGCLVAGGLLEVLGGVWMHRITRSVA